MILKEFSDYIKSREALAESVSTSTADADKSGIFGNSAGSADAADEGSEGSKELTDPTNAMKTTKSTAATSTESATDSAEVFCEAESPKNPVSEDSEGATYSADPTVGAGAPDPTNATKTEERGKMLQNKMEAFSTTDSEEVREARGQDPVSRGVRQPQNSNFSCVKLLNEWLVKKLRSVPISNVDKIICNELFLATNKKGATLIIAKRESGRKLLRALYNFSLSYEHYRFARRTHEVRPSNFTNRKD